MDYLRLSMSFKLPIDLIGTNKAVFLVTVEGIYIIGLFEWSVRRWSLSTKPKNNVSHHEEFYILKSTPPAIKLRRELGAIQKDLQRLISKRDDMKVGEITDGRQYLADKAFQLVSTYLQNPPAPVIPYSPATHYINQSINGWKDFTPSSFRQNMQAASRRMMRNIGKSMEGKSLDEMRTPQINTLRYVKYVAINYVRLPNRKGRMTTLPATLLKDMARQYLK